MSGYTTHATGMSATPPPPPPAVSPDAPTGLSVSAVTDTSVTWSWDAVDGADGYQVQFNSAENFDGVDAMNTAETWHTQTGLSAGMAGYLRVRSTSGSGDAMLASAWTAHLTATTRMRPGIPMNLSAAAGEGSITWTWDAVDNADSYYVQHSADGGFTAEGESMEVMETSYTKSDLETGATAYLRVRSSDGTGDQERLMSGWSSPIRGMSATPVTPPAPTGLNSTSGDGSISWSWNAVDGAMGYQVQVSMSEDFGDAETIDLDADTTSHSVDVDAGSTRYLRVRATGMGDPSGWSTHVTGMSNAPPPPPPPAAPDPVMVTFSLEKGHYLEADDGRNVATAMAYVNKKITVESNAAATITPMFVENANPVGMSADSGNMPFTFVKWGALQSKVLSDEGVTFKITRGAGANPGDVAYVTCGPFDCSESSNDGSPPAPKISIANSTVCNDFDPEVSLQVGFVDNNGVAVGADDYTEVEAGTRANDGVDVGWVTTSMVDMTVKHHFSSVARGRNFNATGVAASEGTSEALAMTNHVTGTTATSSTINDDDFKGALLVGTLDAADGGAGLDPCADANYDDPRSDLHKPDSCFRVTAAGDSKTGVNYLGGYSIEFAAKDSGVSWGKVAWDPNPFKDLKCENMSYMATEVMEADVCELFGAEVDRAMAEKWGGSKGMTVTFLTGTSTSSRPGRTTYLPLSDTNANHLVALQIEAPDAESRRFASLWYNDNDKRTDSKDKSNHDLYAEAAASLHIELVDEDGDPKYEDFGKVDFAKANAAGDAHVHGEDGTAESAPGGESKCSHSDGENCDGMLEETITVTFDAGLAIGCTPKHEVTISCTWDANGEMAGYRADDHNESVTLDTDDNEGLTSTFGGFRTSPDAGREDGDIAAFVKCKVS